MRITEYLPESLKPFPIWCLWRLEQDPKGRMTKIPYSAMYYGRASSTKPRSWATFDKAQQELKDNPGYYCGLALAVSEELKLIFIDIDDCIDDQKRIAPHAQDILKAFQNSFAEVSQSGRGIHILTKGTIPRSFKNSKNGVEMYNAKRFCSMTGKAILPFEPFEDQPALDYVFDKYKTPDPPKPIIRPVPSLSRSDQWIIERGCRNRMTSDLFSGNWQEYFGSQSEADLSLCMRLAFWTDCNPDQMDRIFRASGLYRAKWDRDDYRNRTLTTAISNCNETYSEYNKRKLMQDEERYLKAWSRY